MLDMAFLGCKKLVSSDRQKFLQLCFLICVANGISQAKTDPILFHFSRIPRHESSSSFSGPATMKSDFESLVKMSMKQAEFARALALNVSLSYKSQARRNNDPAIDCLELLDDTIDILSNIKARQKSNSGQKINDEDVRTWLSAAVTNQDTCIESIREVYNASSKEVGIDLVSERLSKLLLDSLSAFVSTREAGSSSSISSPESFPDWVSSVGRKLLEAPVSTLNVQAIVAADGSGTHKSIGEALRRLDSEKKEDVGNTTIIYLKAGIYHESIKIPTKQKNVVLIGDGKERTTIVGDKNFKDGSSTFRSATIAAMGNGFMIRDMTIVNSAGPNKGQAVALRLGSDKSVVYRCSIQGYQDTLYAHSKRQFYRDIDVYGSVDFIFGNAAAVFQNCNIFVRSNQGGYITAQGRSDPEQNTGFSIHNCKIRSASNQTQHGKVFLGRPWRTYARVVYMQSYMDNSIHPSGWAPWNGKFNPNTVYYGEYNNNGPGSSISGRVKWWGCHPSLSSKEADKFTVGVLINGNEWLPSTNVSFTSGLYQ